MLWKKLRGIFLPFIAGMMIMGGAWLGYDNTHYFSDGRAFADQTVGESLATNVQVNPITSENVVAEMVKDVGPAVVRIETTSTALRNNNTQDLFEQFFSPFPFDQTLPKSNSGVGSGFIIREDGYIITNHHVIAGADSIQVYMSDFEQPVKAKVIGKDPELDLAVLKIDIDQKLPFLMMGDSEQIEVGEWSVAIGNPFGLDHTVTVGVISAKSRPLTIEGQSFKNLLQTDASINPGNSGGPLLNLKGEVIGINTAINAQGQGLGFAIPINTVKEVLDDLINNGKVTRPWLGVGIQDLNGDLANYFNLDVEEGVIIARVFANSPAAESGLKQGDVVIEIDGDKVNNSEELVNMISKAKVGEELKLLILRNGNLQTVTVKIGEKSYN